MRILTSNLNGFGVYRIYISKLDSSIFIKSIGALATSRFGVREEWVTLKEYLSKLEYILNQIKKQ